MPDVTITISQKQADTFAEKIMDLGNLAIVGIFVEPLATGTRLNLGFAVLGIMAFLVAYGIAFRLLGGGVY